jgi:hypothetical protein
MRRHAPGAIARGRVSFGLLGSAHMRCAERMPRLNDDGLFDLAPRRHARRRKPRCIVNRLYPIVKTMRRLGAAAASRAMPSRHGARRGGTAARVLAEQS